MLFLFRTWNEHRLSLVGCIWILSIVSLFITLQFCPETRDKPAICRPLIITEALFFGALFAILVTLLIIQFDCVQKCVEQCHVPMYNIV